MMPIGDPMFESKREGFIQHLRVKNYSPHSVSAYGGHLRPFLTFLERRKVRDLKSVNRVRMEDYYLDMTSAQPKLSLATIAVRVRSVKRFFDYLVETEQVYENPAQVLHEPTVTRKAPKVVLCAEEVDKILDANDLSTVDGIRGRAMLEVIYSTGVRLSELLGLRLLDVNLGDGLLMVRQGKGKKDRVVPLGKHAVRFLQVYLDQSRPALIAGGLSKTDLPDLWLNKRGTPIQRFHFIALIRQTVIRSGIGKRVSPHVFRRSAATLMLKAGADVQYVKELLGHSLLRTTQGYTQVSSLEAKEAHEKAHPRNKPSGEESVVSKLKGVRR